MIAPEFNDFVLLMYALGFVQGTLAAFLVWRINHE